MNIDYFLNLGFTFWLLFFALASVTVYVVDFLFFQRARLAPFRTDLKGLNKKQKRDVNKKRGGGKVRK